MYRFYLVDRLWGGKFHSNGFWSGTWTELRFNLELSPLKPGEYLIYEG